MNTPLAITAEDFEALKGLNAEGVERRFTPLIRRLIQFLNDRSSLHGLQGMRSKWANPRSEAAFDRFNANPEHWYLFNLGGRSEAQFNIGMYPAYMRIGIGFQFGEWRWGKPNEVASAYTQLLRAVAENGPAFRRLIRGVPLEMEFAPGRRDRVRDIYSGEYVAEVLHELPREPKWIFMGRILRYPQDLPVLADARDFQSEIDRVFTALLPWWKKANRASVV